MTYRIYITAIIALSSLSLLSTLFIEFIESEEEIWWQTSLSAEVFPLGRNGYFLSDMSKIS